MSRSARSAPDRRSAPGARRWLAPALALAVLCASPALAQDTDPPPWLGYKMPNGPQDPFRYYTDTRFATAGGLTRAEWLGATRPAWNTWDNVACAYTSFLDAGSMADSGIADPRDPYDLYNVSTVWITSTTDPYYDYALAGGAASASSIPLTYAGNLYQCDIYVNGVNRPWSTAATTPADKDDLRSYLIHEIGHCQGLGHASHLNSVMYPSLNPGEQQRQLKQPDVDAICSLYPATGAVGSPCTTSCSAPSDGGTLHCLAPFLPDGGSAPKICTRACDPTIPNRCPAPFVCKPSTQIANRTGACLPSYGDAVTQVGKPCTVNGDCGSANGLCILPSTLPSGNPAWESGYCTQPCGGGTAECPAGSACADFGGGTLRCMKTCRPGTGDCRSGYACLLVSTDAPALCLNACYTDADCNGGASTGPNLCRPCDGICLARQNATAQIGDPCTTDSSCGTGQLCIKLSAGSSTQGVCSQPCTNSCSTCPTGSACHVLQGQQTPWCLRSCVSGSCPPGQRCGLLSTGNACIPGCTDSNQCPVGTSCQGGDCLAPSDAGCVLCGGGADAGEELPRTGARPDAGTGGLQSGGCGCQGVAGAPLWAMLAFLLLGARRAWPRR